MLKNKKVIALIALVVVVIGLVAWGLVARSAQKNNADGELIQNEEAIPTVDASVQVSLEPSDKKGDVVVTIKNAPDGTQKADIELSYQRERQAQDETVDETIPDGAIAGCDFKGSRDCKKDGITLGTCSSGVCRYHKVVGKIKLYVLFKGDYGQKKFEKEFSI